MSFEALTVKGNDNLGSYEILKISLEIYQLPVILKTAYWFTDRVFLQLRRCAQDKNVLELIIRAKGNQELCLENIAGEFCNSLIDQSVREIVNNQTQGIRDVIVKKAFSEASSPSENLLLERLGR